MKHTQAKHHIEILPAAWLTKGRPWRRLAQSLPAGACLLVINSNDSQQAELMQSLAHSFRQKGRRVVVWRVE